MHNQNYRSRLKELLQHCFPGADVYDPLADHGQSLDYNEDQGRRVFFRHNQMCGEVDVVVAFVPEASMGTAIEIWEAYQHGRLVITVSPLSHNWAVKFCSHFLFPSMEALEDALLMGGLPEKIKESIRERELP